MSVQRLWRARFDGHGSAGIRPPRDLSAARAINAHRMNKSDRASYTSLPCADSNRDALLRSAVTISIGTVLIDENLFTFTYTCMAGRYPRLVPRVAVFVFAFSRRANISDARDGVSVVLRSRRFASVLIVCRTELNKPRDACMTGLINF